MFGWLVSKVLFELGGGVVCLVDAFVYRQHVQLDVACFLSRFCRFIAVFMLIPWRLYCEY